MTSQFARDEAQAAMTLADALFEATARYDAAITASIASNTDEASRDDITAHTRFPRRPVKDVVGAARTLVKDIQGDVAA